ncbi:hypothetical protein J1G42_00575 [Cellulomonas sp. zg-ZUI222]|uniref:hypothetical protein n=1 Tax=Cellulomonas wangleii TaxID=2816956 RepID=UPI001A94C601|nr:hypothetical protein [Cellulomonas wangleii]MBO0919320.1 hypothetical protein [Cellulomonas wangleii]MBO0924534.1 hypothetical protein [Cellulomonas wangleii]
MTTEGRRLPRALPSTVAAVPTPRSGTRAVTPGLPLALESPAEEPERRSRSVLAVGAVLLVVTVAALVVAFRIIVPAAPAAAPAPELVDTGVTEVQERPGTVVGYGQEYTYGDGLGVVVGYPQVYEPSDNATGFEGGSPVKAQVVVTNSTGESFRPNTIQVSATSGGQPVAGIWDPDQGVGLTGPDVNVPPGGMISFEVAFAVPDGGDLRLEIVPALYGYGAMVVEAL